jgi:hypothetical protein
VSTYFYVSETDDQGRPQRMLSLIDNKDLIKKSPLLTGSVGVKQRIKNTPILPTYISTKNQEIDLVADEAKQLFQWIHCEAFGDAYEHSEPESAQEQIDYQRPLNFFSL